MAIVSIWSNGKEETAKTLSVAAIATSMAIEHNFKILLLSTNFDDDSLETCFWEKENPNEKKKTIAGVPRAYDFDAGIEGLTKVIKSNRSSPEVISNYTKIIFKDRLDFLQGIKTKDYESYKRLCSNYVDILQAADQYYDLVIVDVNKGLDNEFIRNLLDKSHLIVTCLSQRLPIIENYIELRKKEKILSSNKNMVMLGRYDKFSKYNAKNIARYIGEKKDICTIPYNTLFFEACNEGDVANYFLKFQLSGESDRNAVFINEVKKTTQRIIYKLQELQMNL